MSGPTPCWSTKQICIKIHVPSLSCPSTGIYIYIYIYIYNIELWSRTNSKPFTRYSEFHASCEAIIRRLYIYNCRQYCFGLLGLISAVLMLELRLAAI